MKSSILILGLMLVAVGVFLSIPLYEKKERTKEEVHRLEKTIQQAKESMNVMEEFKEEDLLNAAHYYALFTSRLNQEANLYGLRLKFEILDRGIKDVKKSTKEYPGINAVYFKATFNDVPMTVSGVHLLTSLNNWQKQFPLKVSSIEYDGTNCQITGGIYGL